MARPIGVCGVVVVVLVHDRTSSNLSEVFVVFVASFVHGPAWTMGRSSFGSVSGDGDRSNALHSTLEEPRTTPSQILS
jgi:hypothetical protein